MSIDRGMRMAVIVAVALCGCSTNEPYREYMDSLPTIGLIHAGDALHVAAGGLGLDAAAVGHVSWVVGGMHRPSGEPVAGVAIACDVWIEWWGEQWTSGASADGPAISHTAFAHELAHCALWLEGDGDAGHLRVGWWGSGGIVERANAALAIEGL